MQSIDWGVLNFFAANRVEWLSCLVLAVTYLGDHLMIAGTTALLAVSFFIHKHYGKILPLIISVAGSAITVFILKNVFLRERPLGALYLEDSFSFPSGHAAAAMALYGFLFLVVWKHDYHKLKNPLLYLLVLLILAVGLSRLYLGVHYLSDVLGGYFIGFLWILISLAIAKLKIWHSPDNARPL